MIEQLSVQVNPYLKDTKLNESSSKDLCISQLENYKFVRFYSFYWNYKNEASPTAPVSLRIKLFINKFFAFDL